MVAFLVSQIRRWRSVYLSALLFWGAWLWVVAAVVRCSVQDLSGWTFFQVIFYAAPVPLLSLTAIFLACGQAIIRKTAQVFSWLLLGLLVPLCAGSAYPLEQPYFRTAARPIFSDWDQLLINQTPETVNASRSPLRVLFWNASHLEAGLSGVAGEIAKTDADVVALVEGGEASAAQREKWQQLLPGYDVTFLGAEILLLIKQGTVSEIQTTELLYNSRVREAVISVAEAKFRLLIADIHGKPIYPRKPSLDYLASRAEQLQSEPLLLVGDFNTPRDSLLFQPLEQQLYNSFDQVGSGYGATWPVPFPVMTLDQAWANRKIELINCQLGWSRFSDHRPLVLEFSVR